jgi:dihydroorotate dehydrogenase
VKIAPDVTQDELIDIAFVVQESGIDGIVISNTTIARPSTLVSGATNV